MAIPTLNNKTAAVPAANRRKRRLALTLWRNQGPREVVLSLE